MFFFFSLNILCVKGTHKVSGTKQDHALSVSRLKVRTGRMGSNSSLSVSSRQDSWDLLKPASLVSSAGARSVSVYICMCQVKNCTLSFFTRWILYVFIIPTVAEENKRETGRVDELMKESLTVAAGSRDKHYICFFPHFYQTSSQTIN